MVGGNKWDREKKGRDLNGKKGEKRVRRDKGKK